MKWTQLVNGEVDEIIFIEQIKDFFKHQKPYMQKRNQKGYNHTSNFEVNIEQWNWIVENQNENV